MSEVSVATFIADIEAGEIVVQPHWQRDDRWDAQAKWSYIGTMISLPRTTLTNLLVAITEDPNTHCEKRLIADGHTRACAILSVMTDRVPIPPKIKCEELKDYVGKYYSELPLPIQQKVKNYKLQIGEFVDPDGSLAPKIAVLVNQNSKPMSVHEQRRGLYAGSLDDALRGITDDFSKAGLLSSGDKLGASFEDALLFTYWYSIGFEDRFSLDNKDSILIFDNSYTPKGTIANGMSLSDKLSIVMRAHKDDKAEQFIEEMKHVKQCILKLGMQYKVFRTSKAAQRPHRLILATLYQVCKNLPLTKLDALKKKLEYQYNNRYSDFSGTFKYSGNVNSSTLFNAINGLVNYFNN